MTKRNFGAGAKAPRIWRSGMDLMADERGLVLEIWEDHRYVVGKVPDWARRAMDRIGAEEIPPQFASDLDWLQNTKFSVTLSGRLDKRCRECRESPTWPTRPDLRDAPIGLQAKYAPNLRYAGWGADATREERYLQAEEEHKLAQLGGPSNLLAMVVEENKRRDSLNKPLLTDDDIDYLEKNGKFPEI